MFFVASRLEDFTIAKGTETKAEQCRSRLPGKCTSRWYFSLVCLGLSLADLKQCAVRMWRATKALNDRITTMNSVIIVQSAWRQSLCKKNYIKAISAAKIIQAKCRGVNARRRWGAITRGVRKIQRRWRLHVFRKCRQTSAIVIQAQWRCRIRFNIFSHILSSTLAIQKCWRAFRDLREFRTCRYAVISIQAAWRRYSARLNYELDILEIVIAQSAVRRMLAQRITEKRRQSLQILQNYARNFLACIQLQNLRRTRDDFLGQCSAATLVQVRFQNFMMKECRGRMC